VPSRLDVKGPAKFIARTNGDRQVADDVLVREVQRNGVRSKFALVAFGLALGGRQAQAANSDSLIRVSSVLAAGETVALPLRTHGRLRAGQRRNHAPGSTSLQR